MTVAKLQVQNSLLNRYRIVIVVVVVAGRRRVEPYVGQLFRKKCRTIVQRQETARVMVVKCRHDG